MNVPFTPYQQFIELNQNLLHQPYTEPNVRMYLNGLNANLNLIVTDRNQLLHLGHLSPISPQLRHLNEEMASYMKEKGRAEKIYRTLRTHIIPEGGRRRLKGGMPIVHQNEEQHFIHELEQIETLLLFISLGNGTETERRTKLRKARNKLDLITGDVDRLHLTPAITMRFDFAQSEIDNFDAQYGMEYGYEEKKGRGFSMNSEREINDGNLRRIGGMVQEDEDLPGDFPFFFQDIFDTLTFQFPNLTRTQQLQIWRDTIEESYQFSFQNLEFETENLNNNTGLPHLTLTPAQRRLVKDVYELYHRWKKILFPTGGRMVGGEIKIGPIKFDEGIFNTDWKKRFKTQKQLTLFISRIERELINVNKILKFYDEVKDKRDTLNTLQNESMDEIVAHLDALRDFQTRTRILLEEVERARIEIIFNEVGAVKYNEENLYLRLQLSKSPEDFRKEVEEIIKTWKELAKKNNKVRAFAENQIAEYMNFLDLVMNG